MYFPDEVPEQHKDDDSRWNFKECICAFLKIPFFLLIAIPVSIVKGLIMGVAEYYKMIIDAMKKIIRRVKDFRYPKHHYRKRKKNISNEDHFIT